MSDLGGISSTPSTATPGRERGRLQAEITRRMDEAADHATAARPLGWVQSDGDVTAWALRQLTEARAGLAAAQQRQQEALRGAAATWGAVARDERRTGRLEGWAATLPGDQGARLLALMGVTS